MKDIISYGSGKFLIERNHGKKIKREKIDIHKYYDMWYERIAVLNTVSQFDYCFEEQKVQIKWLELSKNGGIIHDDTFYLDDSVKNKPLALRIFSKLSQEFDKRKNEYVDYLVGIMDKLSKKYQMDSLVNKMMNKYSKIWSLESFDKREVFEVASRIEKMGYRKGLTWATGLEKMIIFILSSYTLIDVLSAFKIALPSNFENFSYADLFLRIGIFWGLLLSTFIYTDACQERTVNDFLDEVRETLGKEYEIFKKSGKTLDDLRIIVEDVFNHMKEHAELLGEDRTAKLDSQEKEIISSSSFTLKERFDHMRRVIEIERDLYRDSDSIGLKNYINGYLSLEDLIKRLTFVDYKKEDVYVEDVFAVLESIENSPYYGCEDDILDLYDLAIENVYLATKYRPEIYDASYEYSSYLSHKREVFDRISNHQKMAKRYTLLQSAKDNLNLTMEEDGSINIETGCSIKFKQINEKG